MDVYDCIVEECDPLIREGVDYSTIESCAYAACGEFLSNEVATASQAVADCANDKPGCDELMDICFEESE